MSAVEADRTQMGRVEADDGRRAPVPRPLLLFALISGMVAWMVHLAGGSALVPAACAHDVAWIIEVLTVVTALVCVAGIVAGVRIHRRVGAFDDARATGYRLTGFVAVTANVISLALVIGEGSMHLLIGACS